MIRKTEVQVFENMQLTNVCRSSTPRMRHRATANHKNFRWPGNASSLKSVSLDILDSSLVSRTLYRSVVPSLSFL